MFPGKGPAIRERKTMRWMTTAAAVATVALGTAGCAAPGSFMTGEVKTDPIYCYQSLAGVECFKTPVHRDERRLVSYNGPAPETYPKPRPEADPVLKAPEMVPFYVKDPEPMPQADPPKRRSASAVPAAKAPAQKR